MEGFKRGQESLRMEVNQLKTQMSLIMEVLQAILRKEDNPTPISIEEMVTHVHMPGSTSYQELAHEYHPQPGLPRLSYQYPLHVTQPSQRNQARIRINI